MNFEEIYAGFHAPIAEFDCGDRCAPYNEWGVPFCCDTRHAVPAAYQQEWEYLQANTDLWHPWQGADRYQRESLQAETPDGQVLIACQGYEHCQREFRSITCRAFPFFPYVTRQGDFIGLSYYWEYEDRCWVISNLRVVTRTYLQEFVSTFEIIFRQKPDDLENFRYHSSLMRRIFSRKRRAIPLLHRNGYAYKVTPRNGRMRRIDIARLPRFGPYQIAAELPFPDEIENP